MLKDLNPHNQKPSLDTLHTGAQQFPLDPDVLTQTKSMQWCTNACEGVATWAVWYRKDGSGSSEPALTPSYRKNKPEITLSDSEWGWKVSKLAKTIQKYLINPFPGNIIFTGQFHSNIWNIRQTFSFLVLHPQLVYHLDIKFVCLKIYLNRYLIYIWTEIYLISLYACGIVYDNLFFYLKTGRTLDIFSSFSSLTEYRRSLETRRDKFYECYKKLHINRLFASD